MHIPDGYLSPSSCLVSYALAMPFWYVAFSRSESLLLTRKLPRLALFSAFCFVIMLFNLPLPGGTSGHAVGASIASIVLGPWAAMLAVSIALLIQALFFGDGGLTTFAANSLNMAIVAPLVSWGIYVLLSGKSTTTSRWRVLVAALAAYIAINVAALLTAVELGLQAQWFLDAQGTPLYAPYSLTIALPAMMLGHLGIAGVAEALVTGGLMIFLQKTHPEWLDSHTRSSQSGRALWFALLLLIVLSPLGLLVTGVAWGEWSIEDFSTLSGRQAIAHASGQHAAPAVAPAGMAKLAGFWNAPLPDYAPSWIPNAGLAYIFCALLGVGLIALIYSLLSRHLMRRLSR